MEKLTAGYANVTFRHTKPNNDEIKVWIDNLKSNKNQIRLNQEWPKCNSDVALVIASGSSLLQDIKLLQQKKNIYTIVCDTAVKTLLENGIDFDAVVSIDPITPVTYIKDMCNKHMFLDICSNPKIVNHDSPKSFLYEEKYSYQYQSIMSDFAKYSKPYFGIGFVGHTSIWVAIKMKFKVIALLGHDMCMIGGKSHTDGLFLSKKDVIININNKYRSKLSYVNCSKRIKELTDQYRSSIQFLNLSTFGLLDLFDIPKIKLKQVLKLCK